MERKSNMLGNYNLPITYNGKNIVYVGRKRIDLRKFPKTAMFKTGWLREALTLYFMQEEKMEFQLADSLACKSINNRDVLMHFVSFYEVPIYEYIYKKTLQDFEKWKKKIAKQKERAEK